VTRKLLLDVDPGIDDALAVMMALGSDDVDVVGLTTVMGNTTVDHTTQNALALLELVDRSEVPVAKGAHRPFADDLVMAEYVHGPGGMPETVRETLPEPTGDPVDEHAADFIIDRAREYGEDLTIAAVGPQTNVALALAQAPDAVGAADIYQMGGALTTTGNVTPQASFNFYVDAPAANRVVQGGWPHVVGLDVTEPAYLDVETRERFAEREDPYDQMVADILEYKAQGPDGKVVEGGSIVSDSVVLAGVLDDVLRFEEAYVEIDQTGGPSNGASIYDEHGVLDEEPNCNAAVDVDRDRCRDVIVSAIERARP
jgi:inosine-uridine nucleoside N-ribohydrolase